MDLRLTPYVLAGGRQDRVERRLDGSGFNQYGLDVKYGVASGLNLDLTLNTDFAQVEVDERQVNLTRFPLFFPRSATSSWRTPACSTSRRVRLRAHGRPLFTRRIGLSEGGLPIPIIGGRG